jgi:tetratricopeptide (TPR) repeat protein
MSRRTHVVTALLVTLSVGFGVLNLVRRDRTPPPAAPFAAKYTEAEVRDRDIEFYSRRLTEDPASAVDRATLAKLFFARSRNTGSMPDLARAERLAVESIGEREHRNYQAFELLASALMGRHAFGEARVIAQRVDSLDPGIPSHLALLGEIELELGDYAAAAAHFDRIQYDGRNFTTGARLARWYELTGRVAKARTFLKQSIARVNRRDDLPREQVAWFHFRLGELELRVGNSTAADSAFRAGLAINPDDPRIMSELSHVAFMRGEWNRAIALAERVPETQRDPEILGVLTSAYARLGDTVQSARYSKAMAIKVANEPGVIHRPWGLFLLDYGAAKDHARVLKLAKLERRNRRDVYAHDLLAWALYRNGRLEEAKEEMRLALAQGTEDVMLRDHARAIGVVASISP